MLVGGLRVHLGGLFRCCLSFLDEERGREIPPGGVLVCRHCKGKMLVDKKKLSISWEGVVDLPHGGRE
jgi:hypothetical protein